MSLRVEGRVRRVTVRIRRFGVVCRIRYCVSRSIQDAQAEAEAGRRDSPTPIRLRHGRNPYLCFPRLIGLCFNHSKLASG